MSNNLEKKYMVLENNKSFSQFLVIIGVLSVLSYPVFLFIWGLEPIGAGKYIELLFAFTIIFFLLLLITFKWAEPARDLFVLYNALVMPAFCILASLMVFGVLSTSVYVKSLIILHVMYILVCFFARNYLLNLPLFDQISRIVPFIISLGYGPIFLGWLYRTYNFLQPDFMPLWRTALAVFFLILMLLVIVDQVQKKLQPSYQWVVIGITGLLLIGLVYRPTLFIDREHYNFFLAPLNDVIHGKIPFVNTTSQYGVGVIYALALVFRGLNIPIGYEGFSFIINMLFILQYVLLAFMLWKTTDDLMLALAGLIAIVYFNYLSVYWPSMLRTPAQSPLRYGLVYLLLYVALFNVKLSNRYVQALDFVFLGIASVWSLETFIYGLFSLDAFYFVKDVLFASQFKEGIKYFGKRIAIQAGIVIVFFGALMIFSRTVSGDFPNPYMYLDYFRAYSNISYNGGPIFPHIFRSGAVIFVYLFSIFAVLFDGIQKKRILPMSMASMLVGMSTAGILQYLYYFVYYIDYHLSLLCVPLIFVLILWFSVIRQHASLPLPLRASLLITLLLGFMISGVVTSRSFYDKFSNSLLFLFARRVTENRSISFTNPYQPAPSNKTVKNLVFLIQRYASSDPQISVFAFPDDQSEALFLTAKTDLLGISAPNMNAISPIYSELVLQQAKKMSGYPTYIFYDTSKDALIPLSQTAYQMLYTSADYRIIDARGNIIVLKKTK